MEQNNNVNQFSKIRTRSERTPIIGDKFCCKMAQMGTIGLQLNARDMPFTENGAAFDLLINPNSIKKQK